MKDTSQKKIFVGDAMQSDMFKIAVEAAYGPIAAKLSAEIARIKDMLRDDPNYFTCAHCGQIQPIDDKSTDASRLSDKPTCDGCEYDVLRDIALNDDPVSSAEAQELLRREE